MCNDAPNLEKEVFHVRPLHAQFDQLIGLAVCVA